MHRAKTPLIELRQYIITPGKRDRMIELFDTHFAKAQNDLGLPILGYFRAVADPDRLVWIRGFPDMETRPTLLGNFYGGPVWTEFGPEAIGYVTGYDNVQLLRETTPGSGLEVDPDGHAGIVAAVTYRLREPASAAFIGLCERKLQELPDGRLLGSYITDPTPNNFPVLPVREGEHLFTWFASAADHLEIPELEPFFVAPPEMLILDSAAK